MPRARSAGPAVPLGGSSAGGDLGLVSRTSLADWSDLNRATAELHLAAGRAYAYAINGNDPYPKTVAELRALHARVGAALEKAGHR